MKTLQFFIYDYSKSMMFMFINVMCLLFLFFYFLSSAIIGNSLIKKVSLKKN